MSLTASFAVLLQTLATGDNKPARYALTLLLGAASQQLGDDLSANCRSVGEHRDRAEAHLSLVMAMRTLWAITPERLFTAADPDYERFARQALDALGPGPGDIASMRALGTIYRRLRSAQRLQRTYLTNLDLGTAAHRRLLCDQNGCCALCRYCFQLHELEYAEAEDDLFEGPREVLPEEVVISRYRHRPVLDHIVPHFLGGDGPENWQILCQSCNTGKGEGLAWIMRRGLLPPVRPSDALTVSPSLRHAVLSNHLATSNLRDVSPSKTGELRLFRRDPTRLPVFDNLLARPEHSI